MGGDQSSTLGCHLLWHAV